MNPWLLLEKYYPPGDPAREILFAHSRAVAAKALTVAARLPDRPEPRSSLGRPPYERGAWSGWMGIGLPAVRRDQVDGFPRQSHADQPTERARGLREREAPGQRVRDHREAGREDHARPGPRQVEIGDSPLFLTKSKD